MTSNQVTPDQAKTGLRIIQAIAETIRECGSAPEGTLYAGLMSRMSLEGFNKCIDILVRTGLVSRSAGHLLTWTGPL